MNNKKCDLETMNNKKIEEGKRLYDFIIKSTNKTIDEIYDIFNKSFQRFELYGDNKEKAILNYCTYKKDNVETYFGLK